MKNRIKELIETLNNASDAYYNGMTEVMTDRQWDKIFDELKSLEEQFGIIYSNSPTQNAGYVVSDGLDKIKHSTPLLSLGKTKSVDDLVKFLGDREGVLSYKLDGGTEILDYKNNLLNYVATRGSSSTNEGQDITHNAGAIRGIMKKISIRHIQVVGEGVMHRSKFEEINAPLPEDEKYANPRNLANASASMLDSKRVAEREVRFMAFGTLESIGFETKIDEFNYLMEQGFKVTPHIRVDKNNIREAVKAMTEGKCKLDYDVDGLVLSHNDISYGLSLGKTSHHFNNAIAFKWDDDTCETIARDVIVGVGRTGQISFRAEFDTVEIEGSEVSYATLHNPSIVNQLGIGAGAKISVYKANQIIPAVDEVLEEPDEAFVFDYKCPSCGKTVVHRANADGSKSENVFCENKECPTMITRKIAHFASVDAMNISGLSEETVKSIRAIKQPECCGTENSTILDSVSQLYLLKNHRDEMIALPRFGVKKVDKLLSAIEDSKTKPLNNVLYGIGIPQVGRSASKKIANSYRSINGIKNDSSWSDLISLLGESVGKSFFNYFFSDIHIIRTIELLEMFGLAMIQPKEEKKSDKLSGMTFVITGKLTQFENRKALEKKIESLGGKKSGSVSSKTTYLINNDKTSTSGKNKDANNLGISIMSEQDFLEMIKED